MDYKIIKPDDPRVLKCYKDLLEYISTKLGYIPPIIEVEKDRFYFKANRIVNFIRRGSKYDLNTIWQHFDDDLFSEEDMISYYIAMGYALCGIEDLFRHFYLED